MDLLARLALVVLYPMLLLARAANSLLRRDPLRVREPDTETLWIQRDSVPVSASYFSEGSTLEGRNHGGFGWIAGTAIVGLAQLFAPTSACPGFGDLLQDREKGIPDEIYTLW
jgi:hypothetical protein